MRRVWASANLALKSGAAMMVAIRRTPSFSAVADRQYSYNLMPFLEIRRFWQNREVIGNFAVFINLAGNVLAFVPFGFFLPMLNRHTRGIFRMALFTFEFSFLVETIQLVSRVGSFDVDDLTLNTLGGILGYLIFAFCDYVRRKVYG